MPPNNQSKETMEEVGVETLIKQIRLQLSLWQKALKFHSSTCCN